MEEDDANSGAHFQSTSISSATFVPDENSETATIIGTGLHNGVPVGFTTVAVDNQGLAPSVYTLILADGYVITGNAISGSTVLQQSIRTKGQGQSICPERRQRLVNKKWK